MEESTVSIDPHHDNSAVALPRKRPTATRVGAVLAVVLVAVVVAWVVAMRMQPADRDVVADPTASPSATVASFTPSGPALASADEIRAAAERVGHAVYWVGEVPDTKYELTVGSQGQVFVRYLPAGETVGTKTPYLTIATYPDASAFANMGAAAAVDGAVSVKYSGGALAVASSKLSTNVNFAFEGANIQVEVFAPEAGKAWSLVESGAATQIL